MSGRSVSPVEWISNLALRHVGILSIQGSQFQITEIPLKTVRPFEMDEVVLTEAATNSSNKLNLEEKDSIHRLFAVSGQLDLVQDSAR